MHLSDNKTDSDSGRTFDSLFLCRIYVKVCFLVQTRTSTTPEYVFGLLSSEVWSRSALILAEQDMFPQLREREREIYPVCG
jgi:hypothetical protein